MISKEEVKRIAKLARLRIEEREEEKFQRELSSILDYSSQLNEVDISNIEPTSHSVLIENVIRNDESREERLEVRKRLVEQAPDKKEEYIKVKAIL